MTSKVTVPPGPMAYKYRTVHALCSVMYVQCVNVNALCNADTVDEIVKRNCHLRENPLLWPRRPKLLRLGSGLKL